MRSKPHLLCIFCNRVIQGIQGFTASAFKDILRWPGGQQGAQIAVMLLPTYITMQARGGGNLVDHLLHAVFNSVLGNDLQNANSQHALRAGANSPRREARRFAKGNQQDWAKRTTTHCDKCRISLSVALAARVVAVDGADRLQVRLPQATNKQFTPQTTNSTTSQAKVRLLADGQCRGWPE